MFERSLGGDGLGERKKPRFASGVNPEAAERPTARYCGRKPQANQSPHPRQSRRKIHAIAFSREDYHGILKRLDTLRAIRRAGPFQKLLLSIVTNRSLVDHSIQIFMKS
jgi:hypothetical protein